MSPDSTSFLQLVINALQLGLQRFTEPDQWSLEVIVAVIVALASLAVVIVKGSASWKRRRKKRFLERSLTTELYSKDAIESSTRYYVQPNGSSVDPTQEAEMRRVVAVKHNLFETVDEYLAQDSSQRHLFLLADSGMGKSSFVLNSYARNQRLPKHKCHRIVVLPLGIPDALKRITEIDDKQNTILFLDAFDEDTKAIEDHKARLFELMDACKDFRRVLITCRTQFFPSDEELPVRTGIFRFEPRRAGESAEYEFWKMYLTSFDDRQVKEYLRKRYSFWHRNRRKRAYEIVQKIPLLSVRPMLLAHIPDVMNSEKEVEYSFQLYEIMVESWLERESYWVSKDVLRAFSERLAIDLYIKRQERGTERIPYSELASLAKKWNITLEDWQIRGRSLLNRDAEGNYKFAHRSIMEYFVVRRLTAGDVACRDIELTDQMNVFEKEVSQSNADRINVRQANSQRVNLVGAYLREADLAGADFREVNLAGADLRRADLTGSDLAKAYLRGTNLAGTKLAGTNLAEANLAESDFREANLAEANLIRANLTRANLTRANLTEADLTRANLTEADLRGIVNSTAYRYLIEEPKSDK